MNNTLPCLRSLRLSIPVEALIISAICVIQPASATTLYVATIGSDTGTGSQLQPYATIQRCLDVAQAGDTCRVEGGTYRLTSTLVFPRSGTANRNITLEGSSDQSAIIKGSAGVTDWQNYSGSIYRAPKNEYFAASQPGTYDARYLPRNLLFVDNSQDGNYSVPTSVVPQEVFDVPTAPGQFYVDRTNRLVYLWLADSSNPTNHLIEMPVTDQTLIKTNNKSFLAISNLRFAQLSNLPQSSAAVAVEAGSDVTISNISVRGVAGSGLDASSTANLTVTDSQFDNNGQLGIHGYNTTNWTLTGNTTNNNNQYTGKQFDPGWEAGALKITYANNTAMDRQTANYNYGSGIWFDVYNRNTTIKNSVATGNSIGIHYEISYTGLIYNNLVYGNVVQTYGMFPGNINGPEGLGIYVSSSAGCRIYNNTTAYNDNASIEVYGPLRDDGYGNKVYSYANDVRNNIVAFDTGANAYGVNYYSDSQYFNISNPVVFYSPNTSDYNLFYAVGTGVNNFFQSPGADNLSAWRTLTAKDAHSIWADPQFVTGDQVATGSPAIDQGTPLTVVPDDRRGVARPQGSQYDIGAYEDSPATVINGLKGDYYSGVNFENLVLTRTDATVDFDWGGGSPDPAIPADYFSVRWAGKIIPRFTESYNFSTNSDDGVRLWVDGQLLIDNWTPHPPTLNISANPISLVAGQMYNIKLEYFEYSVGTLVSLYWESPSEPAVVIPASQLTRNP